ncbi:hypothetical protein TCAL_02244 [Tigriopus californicus]|uniref:RecF/RecN/SMC N-terminal domain-containing protein n=1 Tax=Tigriopus californicus TaxID=6832 RepID=A0A553P6J2_TIGCA|nr:structural maintenance of chromosomes protein 6-like [Tigriopus californicus]TRY73305.1 hypothetical protein TCAL_02244 [Tigriopus californicus]|eukprot:TCALIF_02244-PA protein Name:"Similar to SMC6 Structural maintenance of chromosomes protein 6 (Homo sapiens)" AED:0.00 eAED:0.00 QI:160/1/1/1/1/1/2/140/1092
MSKRPSPSHSSDPAIPATSQSARRSSKFRRITHTQENGPVGHTASPHQSPPPHRLKWKAEAGTILRVSLKNFMCHASFTYRPQPRLNFLSGVNGSGKSAVLTAITFALGGTARTANRGTSTKSFVRTGATAATVELTLSNQGEYGYRSDLYGTELTIVRHVTSGGTGGYKLKNFQGQIVVDKRVREELDRILLSFRIEVDNPIGILHQDAAKTFLFQCHPHKLYEFFMRATQLEKCKADYFEAAAEREFSASILQEKVEALPSLQAEKLKWEQKLQLVEDIASRDNSLQEKKVALAWSVAKEAEAALNVALMNVQKMEIKAHKAEQLSQEQVTEQKKLKKEKIEIEKQIQELAKAKNERDRAMQELRKVFQKEKEAENLQKKSCHELESQIETKKSDISSLEDEITRLKAEGDAEFVKIVNERTRRIETLAQQVSTWHDQVKATEGHLFNQVNNQERLQGQLLEAKAVSSNKNRSLEVKEKELKQMRESGNSKLLALGSNMPTLIGMIQRSKSKFGQMPVGPLGSMINFKPEVSDEVKIIVENELRTLFSAFVVNSFKDKTILQALMKSAKVQGQVITTKFMPEKYELTHGSCQHDKHRNLLSFLDIPNAVAFNVVVDQRRLEQILLFEHDCEAQQLLKLPRTVPKNCLYGLTMSKNQFFPAPAYRTYVVSGHMNRPFLQCDSKDFIKAMENDIEGLIKESRHAQTVLSDLQSEVKKGDIERKRNEKIINDLKCKIKAKNMELSQLKTEAETEQAPDISALEEDRDRFQSELKELEKQLQTEETKLEELKQLSGVAKANLVQKRDETDVFGGVDDLSEKLGQVEETIRKTERDKAYYKKKYEDYTTQVRAVDKEADQLKAKYNELVTIAQKCAPEPDHPLDKPDKLRREVATLKNNLSQQKAAIEPKEVVVEYMNKHHKLLEDAQTMVNTIETSVSKLEKMLVMRKKGFEKIRLSIIRRVKNYFNVRLAARKYTGEIIFDIEAQTMELIVCPDGADPAVAKRSMKTLSGGEKSYSTISLVLSLWDVMSPPFRILDEFDVFMDMLNRRAALQQIVEYAKMKRQYQYIFLTPLNTDNITVDEDLSIIRLEKSQD